MQINKINSTNFSGVTVIKSKDPKFINFLNDVDYDILRKRKNPKVRFDAPACDMPKSGFWTGILADGKDAECINAAKTGNAKEIEIKSVTDILNLPQLKNFKSTIMEYGTFSAIMNHPLSTYIAVDKKIMK